MRAASPGMGSPATRCRLVGRRPAGPRPCRPAQGRAAYRSRGPTRVRIGSVVAPGVLAVAVADWPDSKSGKRRARCPPVGGQQCPVHRHVSIWLVESHRPALQRVIFRNTQVRPGPSTECRRWVFWSCSFSASYIRPRKQYAPQKAPPCVCLGSAPLVTRMACAPRERAAGSAGPLPRPTASRLRVPAAFIPTAAMAAAGNQTATIARRVHPPRPPRRRRCRRAAPRTHGGTAARTNAAIAASAGPWFPRKWPAA